MSNAYNDTGPPSPFWRDIGNTIGIINLPSSPLAGLLGKGNVRRTANLLFPTVLFCRSFSILLESFFLPNTSWVLFVLYTSASSCRFSFCFLL